jgi:hypothetical protein
VKTKSAATRQFVKSARFTAVLLLVSLALATTADGAPKVRILGSQEVQSTVEAFLVPALPRPVRVRLQPCPGDPSAQGCHSSTRRMDTIWLNADAGGTDTETVAHEMGHVFESYMWDLRWRQLPGSDFVPNTFFHIAAILFEHPRPGILYSTAWSEQFAESYSACARFPSLAEPLYTGYWGFEMTPAQHERVCPLIDTMARRYEELAAPGPAVLDSLAVSRR